MEKGKVEINIEGQEGNANWRERFAKLKDNIFLTCNIASSLDGLSESEAERFKKKAALLMPFFRSMILGMLKGTLKYSEESDSGDLDDWFSQVLGEGADFMNYIVLANAAWERKKEPRFEKDSWIQ